MEDREETLDIVSDFVVAVGIGFILALIVIGFIVAF